MEYKFIKVTNTDDIDVTIAIDHIILYRKLENYGGLDEVVQIKLTGGYQVCAKITVKDFEDQIKNIIGHSVPLLSPSTTSKEIYNIESNLNY